MKKMILLAMFALAGCPSTVAPGRGTSPNAFGKLRCPDPTTECTQTNGRRVTGVIVDDAPTPVTSIQLRSGESIVVK
jgi:hypothetical protein